jgi:hypothetical protein
MNNSENIYEDYESKSKKKRWWVIFKKISHLLNTSEGCELQVWVFSNMLLFQSKSAIFNQNNSNEVRVYQQYAFDELDSQDIFLQQRVLSGRGATNSLTSFSRIISQEYAVSTIIINWVLHTENISDVQTRSTRLPHAPLPVCEFDQCHRCLKTLILG